MSMNIRRNGTNFLQVLGSQCLRGSQVNARSVSFLAETDLISLIVVLVSIFHVPNLTISGASSGTTESYQDLTTHL
jgi:hypothetical protein